MAHDGLFACRSWPTLWYGVIPNSAEEDEWRMEKCEVLHFVSNDLGNSTSYPVDHCRSLIWKMNRMVPSAGTMWQLQMPIFIHFQLLQHFYVILFQRLFYFMRMDGLTHKVEWCLQLLTRWCWHGCCSVVVVLTGVYSFYLAKKSVDKNRVELMKSKRRIKAALAEDAQQKD